jgi:hypothetical protein
MSRRLSQLALNSATFSATFDAMNSKTRAKTWQCHAVLPAGAGDFKSAAGAVFIVSLGKSVCGEAFDARAVEVHVRPDLSWCFLVCARAFECEAALAKLDDHELFALLAQPRLIEHVVSLLDHVESFVDSLRKCVGVVEAKSKGADQNERVREAIESWSNTTRAVANPDEVTRHGQPNSHVKGMYVGTLWLFWLV